MNLKIILCLALVLSGGLFGCSAAKKSGTPIAPIQQGTYEMVTNAINSEDWNILQGLAMPGMRANEYIQKWEKYPVRVGKLIRVEKDSKYYLDGKPCAIYSFGLKSKDGISSGHELQVLIREENGKFTILDFWNFGW